jgi:hypothetical protein
MKRWPFAAGCLDNACGPGKAAIGFSGEDPLVTWTK